MSIQSEQDLAQLVADYKMMQQYAADFITVKTNLQNAIMRVTQNSMYETTANNAEKAVIADALALINN